jgi:hypothetical protein
MPTSKKKLGKNPIPPKEEQKKMTTKKTEKLTKASSPKECPPGQIRRPAYIKESYSRIIKKDNNEKIIHIKKTIYPAMCIKDRGKPGVGLYDIKPKDVLGKYGYKHINSLSLEDRHKALDKAYIGFNKNWLSLFRTINYLAILNKSKPVLYGKLMNDRNYIRTKYNDSPLRKSLF